MKLSLIASLSTVAGALVFALVTSAAPATVDAADACQHKELKTELIKAACTKGGQKEAKDTMKAFMKEKKLKSCNECHSKLAPSYELKPDGLEKFTKLGGK